jgi:excinuclease ABC subunit A
MRFWSNSLRARKDEPIAIRGARVHNLQGVDCDLPRESLVVVTGPSGSGKSSLAFDTLYAEGQRRYVESLSAYARQFLEQMEKPDVESVTGLSPAIAIEQRTTASHPRSTVGTVTEIYDHLRVLFAALGKPHCPRCGRVIASQSAEQIADRLLRYPEGTVLALLAPVVRGRKGAFKKELAELAAQGLVRARVDGRVRNLAEPLALEPRRNHRIDVIVDRVVIRPGIGKRLRAGLEKALTLARDTVLVSLEGGGERLYSRRHACVECDVSVGELRRRPSRSTAPTAPAQCQGLGHRWEVDPAKVIPDESRTVLEGAIHPWQRHGPRLLREALEDVAKRHNFSLEVPVRELSKKARQVLLSGDGAGFAGAVPYLKRRLERLVRMSPGGGEEMERSGRAGRSKTCGYLKRTVCADAARAFAGAWPCASAAARWPTTSSFPWARRAPPSRRWSSRSGSGPSPTAFCRRS